EGPRKVGGGQAGCRFAVVLDVRQLRERTLCLYPDEGVRLLVLAPTRREQRRKNTVVNQRVDPAPLLKARTRGRRDHCLGPRRRRRAVNVKTRPRRDLRKSSEHDAESECVQGIL